MVGGLLLFNKTMVIKIHVYHNFKVRTACIKQAEQLKIVEVTVQYVGTQIFIIHKIHIYI